MGIIPKNLAKGKLIEVATTNIFNTQIDIVNLRNNDQNQIPTPLSDALRRDLSINSMFYNINEQKVEDFTQRGIKDLEQGIINTPVDSFVAILNISKLLTDHTSAKSWKYIFNGFKSTPFVITLE